MLGEFGGPRYTGGWGVSAHVFPGGVIFVGGDIQKKQTVQPLDARPYCRGYVTYKVWLELGVVSRSGPPFLVPYLSGFVETHGLFVWIHCCRLIGHWFPHLFAFWVPAPIISRVGFAVRFSCFLGLTATQSLLFTQPTACALSELPVWTRHHLTYFSSILHAFTLCLASTPTSTLYYYWFRSLPQPGVEIFLNLQF